MKIGFYSGSFDPFTNGHLHVVKQSLKLFDKVIIGIATNSSKNRRFPKELMKKTIQQVLERENISSRVSIVCFENLTVDVAEENNTLFLVRGIRNGADYEFEENISLLNEKVGNLDTIYFRAGDLGFISSTMVMELFKNGRDVSEYLPFEVLEAIKNHNK